MFDVSGTGINAGEFVGRLKDEHTVWMGAKDDKVIRAAIHHQVSDSDVSRAIQAASDVAGSA